MPTFAPTIKDRISLIWTGDPAVDQVASDLEGYRATADKSKLALTGDPQVYHLRPLLRREIFAFTEMSQGGIYLSALSEEALAVALLEVTGPHPVTELALRKARVRDQGIQKLPYGSPLLEDPEAFPAGAALEVGLIYLQDQGLIGLYEGGDETASKN